MRGPPPRPPGMKIMSGPVGALSRTLVLYGNIYHISCGAFTSLARAHPRDVRAPAARNGCSPQIACLALSRDDPEVSSGAQKNLFFSERTLVPAPAPVTRPRA